MKLLVINADDLGYSAERNEGIMECFKKGGITHATLMVNGIAAEHAVRRAKEVSLPIGMHFNITEGIPIAETTKTSSIVDQHGYFLSRQDIDAKVKDKQIVLEDVKTELLAQLERFRSLTGHLPTHVDGHQHINISPDVAAVFAEVVASRGVKTSRLPLDPILMLKKWAPARWGDSFVIDIQYSKLCQPIYKEKGIRASDSFIGLGTMGKDMTIERIKAGLAEAYAAIGATDNPVCEMMVHPGFRNGSVGGCGTGPDEFSQSEEREHEIKVLTDPALLEYYKQEDIKLAPFQECL